MIWESFIYFVSAALICWVIGAFGAWRSMRFKWVGGATVLGLLIFFAYIMLLWNSLDRPPLRTMGETRLWYSFFLPLAGLITYVRWKYKWILSFSTVLSLVFILINLLKPEIHDKVLMPALQSPWFAPHVIVYMFAYALLGASATLALYLLLRKKPIACREMALCDDMVNVGLSFMTMGMLMGALWAKEAWGDYWSWDPKETWALITWLTYLTYLHFRLGWRQKNRWALGILLLAFLFLQVCWWGIDYLPSAQSNSIHIYSMQ